MCAADEKVICRGGDSTPAPHHRAVNLEFSNVTYQAGGKTILHGVNGFFKSGQLSAILGPSGAGKSSLMNILIGYKASGVTGSISANGRKRDARTFHKISCYIQQEELVQPHLTVDEAMSVAACLKLGPGVSKEKIRHAVGDILSTLGLTTCRSTKAERLSGGQKKRLSIALELLSNPPVLFLDEPTTGLDVVAASQCMRHLSSLAAQGRTIVCTIHQPSASIFALFQHVYFLADGRCVYQGGTAELVDFLTSVRLPCPHYSNPADHVIELAHASSACVRTLSEAVKNGKLSLGSNCVLHSGCVIDNLSDEYAAFPTSSFSQFTILLRRMILQSTRSKAMMRLLFFHHVMSAILLGGMFKDSGNDAGKAFQNIKYFISVIVFFLYAYMMAAVVVFPQEVKLLKREYFNRWYGLKPYFLAMSVSRLPLQMSLGMVFMVISYYLTGQPLEAHRFIPFAVICLLVAGTSESLGLLIGSICSVTYGSVVAPAISGAYLMLAIYGIGFGPTMDPIWIFFQSFTYVRYALSGFTVAMYGAERDVLPCNDTYCHFRRPTEITKLMGMTNDQLWVQLTVLSCFFILFKVLSYLALRARLTPEFGRTYLQYLPNLICKR